MSRELPERTATPAELAEERRRAARQPNRAGRPWQRADGRWADRVYPLHGGKPRMVYGKTEDEVLARKHDLEAELGGGQAEVDREAEAAAFIEGSTPEQQRVREILKPPRPEKPIRFTLDLDRAQHMFLKTWAVNRGTGGAAVLRALLRELEDDPDLAIRVRDRLWAEKR